MSTALRGSRAGGRAMCRSGNYSTIRKSARRLSLATNAERVCAEIMLKQSAPFADPRRRKRAEQQQQADQAGEDRQHADALYDAGVAHPYAHPAVAGEG